MRERSSARGAWEIQCCRLCEKAMLRDSRHGCADFTNNGTSGACAVWEVGTRWLSAQIALRLLFFHSIFTVTQVLLPEASKRDAIAIRVSGAPAEREPGARGGAGIPMRRVWYGFVSEGEILESRRVWVTRLGVVGRM